jgi:hypothetical protein
MENDRRLVGAGGREHRAGLLLVAAGRNEGSVEGPRRPRSDAVAVQERVGEHEAVERDVLVSRHRQRLRQVRARARHIEAEPDGDRGASGELARPGIVGANDEGGVERTHKPRRLGPDHPAPGGFARPRAADRREANGHDLVEVGAALGDASRRRRGSVGEIGVGQLVSQRADRGKRQKDVADVVGTDEQNPRCGAYRLTGARSLADR